MSENLYDWLSVLFQDLVSLCSASHGFLFSFFLFFVLDGVGRCLCASIGEIFSLSFVLVVDIGTELGGGGGSCKISRDQICASCISSFVFVILEQEFKEISLMGHSQKKKKRVHFLL